MSLTLKFQINRAYFIHNLKKGEGVQGYERGGKGQEREGEKCLKPHAPFCNKKVCTTVLKYAWMIWEQKF